MSATIIRVKRQTTIPDDVFKAAGLRVRDHVDWRFEGGEIRVRKLEPAAIKRTRPKGMTGAELKALWAKRTPLDADTAKEVSENIASTRKASHASLD